MATLLEWLRGLLASIRGGQHDGLQWVEPGNAITRTILSGAELEIPIVEPSPLAPVAAEELDLAPFEEKPIPPLGVDPPLIQPQLAPAWEAPAQPAAVPGAPRPRVAGQAENPAPEKAGDRKKRRWWRAA